MNIRTVVDKKRGCGWRRPGGLYLMGGGEWMPCGKLPIELTVCKHCGAGIKVTRSLQRIDLKMLIEGKVCSMESEGRCNTCLVNQADYAWLMSVGEKFYKLPQDFANEALEQGISKRIHALPHGFKVGESIVALAHHKAILRWADSTEEVKGEPTDLDTALVTSDALLKMDGTATKAVTKAVYTPGIFMLYRPTRVEYIVKGDETEEFLQALVERGIEPVKVEQYRETQIPLPDLQDEELDASETQTEPQTELEVVLEGQPQEPERPDGDDMWDGEEE